MKINDEDKYCIGCGQKQEDSNLQRNDNIPEDARCRYCMGRISRKTGECVLCHKPYFEEVKEDTEEKSQKEENDSATEPDDETPKEPRCKYCNGRISEETGRCFLCNRVYNSSEEDVSYSQTHRRNNSMAKSTNTASANIDDPFASIRNSNSRYKSDLEKYGTSASSYDGNILFDRVGRKIMGLAKFIFWAITIINALVAIFLIYTAIKGKSFGPVFIALIVAVAGVLVAWLSSVLLYGYGQLIDSQQDVVEELSEIKKVLKKNSNVSEEKKK